MRTKSGHCAVHPFAFFAVTTFSYLLLSVVCILGISDRVLAAKSASQAISDIDAVLGDPNEFVDDVWVGVNSFVSEHFGAMAVATGFGIAIRSITR